MIQEAAYRPVDDEVVGGGAPADDVVGVLVGHVLRGEAGLGVEGGKGVAHLVPRKVH